ncbi:glycosyltransferase 87 family protein [Arthrobacter sp. NA-172]|uniref:glycosyltransferase 87 family protein n=1 Tax=Arthrobacter sp. NA-172 TaxID=3367524 RepID=UPI003754D64E
MDSHEARRHRSPGARVVTFVILPGLLLFLVLVQLWTVMPGNPVPNAPMIGTCLSWFVLVPAVAAMSRVPRRVATALIAAGALLLGAAAMSAPPRTSNDSARYAWDGIVQKNGISPYAFAPVNEALSGHRPSWLFAAGTSGAHGDPVCPPAAFATEAVPASGYPSGLPLCTAINRPQAPTIYPPAAEYYFFLVRSFLPDTVGYLPFQLAGFLLSGAVTVILMVLLRRRRLPQHLAAVWAWSPFVQLEAVNNAHVDILGTVLLLAAGMLLVSGKPSVSGRPISSGIFFGAAVATKLIPAIAAPALLFRRPTKFILTAVAAFVALYVPYVLVAGTGILGFLPGYLKEEGYSQAGGIRFGLAQIVSTGPWPMLLSLAALAAIAVVVYRRSSPSTVWQNQTLMIGLTLLLVSPNYPWYALMLLPFIVLSRKWEYIMVIIALDVIYLGPPIGPNNATTGKAALLVALLAIAAAQRLQRRRNIESHAFSVLGSEAKMEARSAL